MIGTDRNTNDDSARRHATCGGSKCADRRCISASMIAKINTAHEADAAQPMMGMVSKMRGTGAPCSAISNTGVLPIGNIYRSD